MSDQTSRQLRAGKSRVTDVDMTLPADQMIPPEQSYLPWLAGVLMFAIASPVWITVGGFLLTPTRVVCVISIPIIFVRLFVMRAYGKPVLTDYLVMFYGCWVMLAYLVASGAKAFIYGGLTTANILGGYLVGRAAIRHAGHLQGVARLLVTIVICLLPFALWEGIYGTYVIPPWIDSIPGVDSLREVDYGRRLGINRAQVVFAHPIHYGLYCSLALSLYFVGLANQVSLGRRLLVAVLVIGACFMSVSTGPLFTLLFQMGLIFFMLFFQHIRNHWKILVYSTGAVYAVLEVLSDRFALYAIASRIAFNPGTAFYRRLIWEYGTAQVDRTPLFGVGMGNWVKPGWMTDSIDNYWLQIAVTSGIPASFAMIAVFLILMFRAGRGTYVKGTDAYNMRVGWTFLFVGLSLALATVTIWNEVLTMVMFLVGAGAYMLQAEKTETAEEPGTQRVPGKGPPPIATRPERIAYTRFPGGASSPASAKEGDEGGLAKLRYSRLRTSLVGPSRSSVLSRGTTVRGQAD